MPDHLRIADELRARWRTGREPMVSADDVLGGAGDALALLVLRSVRTSSWLILTLGLIIAWATGQTLVITDLTTASGLLEALRTPLVVVATGVVIRFALTPAAWLLALTAMLRAREPPTLPAGEGLSWTDLARTADAWRALRWTLDVRHRAVALLGDLGRLLVLTEIALRFATGLAFTAFVALAAG